jgi:hypothetical protein
VSIDLIEDHRELLQLSEALLTSLRRSPPATGEEIAQMRANLGKRAAQHLLAEDSQIVRPLFATGRIHELPDAEAAITTMRQSRARYSNHVGQWTPQAIEADRPGYLDALIEIVRALRELFAIEEKDLYWPAARLLLEDATKPRPNS